MRVRQADAPPSTSTRTTVQPAASRPPSDVITASAPTHSHIASSHAASPCHPVWAARTTPERDAHRWPAERGCATMPAMEPVFVVAAVFLVSTSTLAYGLYNARRADRSQTWDVAKGELLSHEVVTVRGRYGSRIHQLRVRYAYEVQGKRHEGDRLCFGALLWETADEALLWVAESQSDGRIEVFYDPARPSDAVLMPGRAGAHGFGLMVIVGGLFSLLSGGLLLRALTALG